jgi:hypothetical protein
MKKFSVVVALVSGLVSAQAFAWSCADSIKSDLQARAAQDFPGQTVNLVLPYIDESGGAVDQYDVKVLNSENQTLTTYEILVNETCSIISLDRI